MKSRTVARIAIVFVLIGLFLVIIYDTSQVITGRAGIVRDVKSALEKRERTTETSNRPQQVGNREAEELTRNVDRSRAIPVYGTIVVNDSGFSPAYDELYENRERYYGRDIEIAGFVETQEGLPENEFLIGRYLLWCCQDDKYFIGFLAIAQSTDLPKPGDTIRITGTIEATPYTNPENGKSFDVPAIRIRELTYITDLQRDVFPF